MVNVKDYINIRYSTRNLSDNEFLAILPDLAEEISKVSFLPVYTNSELLLDWKKLCAWQSKENSINSTSRIGMKLCENFFPNFYNIENNKGDSFTKLWTKDNLIKILKWNRKSHSTPYMSELKRGIYFCCGLPKSTMYRPQMMKLVCMKYNSTTVLDPCAGWGGRMLGAVAADCDYYAFEPNQETYNNLLRLADFLDIKHKVNIFCDDARNMKKYNIPLCDLVLTSPPYFDLEIYTHDQKQSITGYQDYKLWADNFLDPVINLCLQQLNDTGVSCWNVGKVGKFNMFDDVINYHLKYNYKSSEVLSVISSKRQINQSNGKNLKNSDDTMVFIKLS